MGRPIFPDSDLVREGMYRSGETVTMSVMRNDDLRRTLAEIGTGGQEAKFFAGLSQCERRARKASKKLTPFPFDPSPNWLLTEITPFQHGGRNIEI